MPKQKRLTFSREFKLEAVRQLDLGDKPAADLARELGIPRNRLYKWREQLQAKDADTAFPSQGRRRGADAELAELMSRKGDCHDNAVAESFFGNLKNELTWHCTFNTRNEARAAIFDYIEVFYNRQRLHQTLGYVSPVRYEEQHAAVS